MTKYAVANVVRSPCIRQILSDLQTGKSIFKWLLLPVSLDLLIVWQRSQIFFFLRSIIGRRYFNVYSVILYSFETRIYALFLTDTRASLQSRYTFFFPLNTLNRQLIALFFFPRELASVHRLLPIGYVCYSFEVEAFLSVQRRKEGCFFKIQTTFGCYNKSTNITIYLLS